MGVVYGDLGCFFALDFALLFALDLAVALPAAAEAGPPFASAGAAAAEADELTLAKLNLAFLLAPISSDPSRLTNNLRAFAKSDGFLNR